MEERAMMHKTILVVDDSPTQLKLMTDPLAGKGFNVVTAVDGEEALEKAASLHPDLILLDVILPKKNGFQVCRQLRTSPGTKDIKIILVTSKTQSTDKFWGLKQGADEYITKPFENTELMAAVSK
jgi:twitching motility two-component system response regulator PilH